MTERGVLDELLAGRKRGAERRQLAHGYPVEIRRVIYTTHGIEAINARLRKVTKKRGASRPPNP